MEHKRYDASDWYGESFRVKATALAQLFVLLFTGREVEVAWAWGWLGVDLAVGVAVVCWLCMLVVALRAYQKRGHLPGTHRS